MKRAIIILAVCYLSLAAIAAGAHMEGAGIGGNKPDLKACHVELNSDITVNPDVIEVATASGHRMVIDENHGVSIDGKTLDLNTDEQKLVDAYATHLRNTIPEIVAIALEGVEIALTAVSEVFYTFSDDGPPESLLATINSIQEEVSARMYQDGNTVHVSGGELSGLEATMNDLEPALAEAVSDSIGDLVVTIGRSIKDGESGLAERIADFTEKMTTFERDVEASVSAKAELLEQRAVGMCEQVYALQATERRLHQEIPATRSFDVVRDS